MAGLGCFSSPLMLICSLSLSDNTLRTNTPLTVSIWAFQSTFIWSALLSHLKRRQGDEGDEGPGKGKKKKRTRVVSGA